MTAIDPNYSARSRHQLRRHGSRVIDARGRDVAKLAEECNFSVSKVALALGLRSHQFKAALEELVGLGPKEFFRHHRAVLARRMISEGVPLQTVSVLLGFRYYTHFAAEIRSFYGICPRSLQQTIHSSASPKSGLSVPGLPEAVAV